MRSPNVERNKVLNSAYEFNGESEISFLFSTEEIQSLCRVDLLSPAGYENNELEL